MNKLPLTTRTTIINMLCEGSSLRAISRITGCSINTVTKLLNDAGEGCAIYHDKHVKDVKANRVQADEIWSFIYSKEKNATMRLKVKYDAGDCYTWVALDADSKLVISWYAGDRDKEAGLYFMQDLQSRLANRIQLTTDGLGIYKEAVRLTFGNNIDFAQLVKVYDEFSQTPHNDRRYSPARYNYSKQSIVRGEPDTEHISTSYVERQNLTMRMNMRRFTRLTNGFSKRLRNHRNALALHYFYYNFCRIHKTLRVTPAMASGITDDIMTCEDIVRLADIEYTDDI